MKRLFLIVSILSAGTVVPAQSYRSMSVWQGSSSTEFSLVAVDSVVMDTDGSLKIVTGSSTETFQAADIDSVTLSVPSIESTNTRNMKELIAEFNGVSINKNSYKPVGTNNPLMVAGASLILPVFGMFGAVLAMQANKRIKDFSALSGFFYLLLSGCLFRNQHESE